MNKPASDETEPQDRLLRAQAASDLTQGVISPSTFRGWAHKDRNGLPHSGPRSFALTPRHRVWRESTILAWMRSRENGDVSA